MIFSNKKNLNNACVTTEGETHNCCSPQPKGKVNCPTCGQKAKGVLVKTLEHLLTTKTKAKLECLDGFYYCKTPSCQSIYFRNGTILSQEDITVTVGLKKSAVPATLCYCFEWTKEKIRAELLHAGETFALDDIQAKMKSPGCSCEILNPSGGCCLGDVSAAIKEIKKEIENA